MLVDGRLRSFEERRRTGTNWKALGTTNGTTHETKPMGNTSLGPTWIINCSIPGRLQRKVPICQANPGLGQAPATRKEISFWG